MTYSILSKHPFASVVNYTFVGLCHESDRGLVKWVQTDYNSPSNRILS